MADAGAGNAAWKQASLAIALLGSLAAGAYGLTHGGVATGLWEDPRASAIGALVLASALAGAMAFARHRGLGTGAVLALAGLGVATTFAGLAASMAVLLVATSAFCTGSRMLGTDVADGSGRVDAILAFASGTAAFSLAVGLLSFAPVNNPATYLLLAAAPLAIGWRRNIAALRGLAAAFRPGVPEVRGWVPWFDFATAFALSLRLLAALHPEIGTDALAMHLVIADRLANEGRFDYDVTRAIWAVMPMAADWQFALAHMLGGEPAARLVNFLADAILVMLVRNVTADARGAFAGAVAAAVYATTPLLFLETASLFVENFWALWSCAALVLAARAVAQPGARVASVCGFLVGTALAAKVITAFLAPFFLVAAAAWCARARPRGWRMLSAFVLAAVAAGVLPYANAWLRTGNPVFPFMNELFHSPLFNTSNSFNNALFNTHAGWRTLYDATFHSGKFLEAVPGAIGLSWLLLLPAALLSALLGRGSPRVAAVCAVLFVVLVFAFQSYLRYVLPVLPVFAFLVGIAAGEAATRGFSRNAVAVLVLACAAAGIYLTPTSNYLHRKIDLPPFAGSEAAEDYVARQRPDRRMARVIDAMQLHRVLWLGTPYIAGGDSDIRPANWQGGWKLSTTFGALGSEDQWRTLLSEGQYDAVALALDAHACDRPFVCGFLDAHARKVFEDGAAALYVLDPDALHTEELLRNGGFDGGTAGWGGEGEFRAGPGDGSVVVSAEKPFNQAVPVAPGDRYLLEVEGRCTPDGADYRAQVNWLDRDGAFIDTSISVFACGAGYESHRIAVSAPPGAATAVVYASGHLPDRTAEITRVSFRK
jgi:hypothetical protein